MLFLISPRVGWEDVDLQLPSGGDGELGRGVPPDTRGEDPGVRVRGGKPFHWQTFQSRGGTLGLQWEQEVRQLLVMLHPGLEP